MPEKITATGKLISNSVLVSNEKEANAIYQKGYFGEMKSGGKLHLALVEALYLVEKGRLSVKDGKKKLDFDALLEIAKKSDKDILLQYIAFDDLRERGFVVKTGFKFGAHFRIYKRGDIPGDSHSAYMVHCIPENYTMSMTEISRIVRLGHSVKKKMWLAIIDTEGDLTYYEVTRLKP